MNLKQVAVLMCVALMGAGAFAYSFLGPPTAELEKISRKNERGNTFSRHEDKSSYIFSFSQQNIGIDGVLMSGKIEDAEITRHYYSWGVALDENFNFNLLLGAVSAEADGEYFDDINATSDFGGDYGFSVGFNFKSTFVHGDTVDWGAMVQTTYFSTEDTIDDHNVEFDDMYDIQIAVGPTIDMDGWKLYGGAYYYLLDGHLDISGSMYSESVDVDEDDEFGIFAGAQFEIMENTDLVIEGAMGDDHYGIGLSIGMRF
ncbi:MAG: hypothetical protein ABFR90_05045 [Planctomycetota bacterium]